MEPEDIEFGDVLEVERKPRAGVVVSVRLSADEADALQGLAERRGTTISKVAREALTSFLTYGPSPGAVTGPWTGTVSSSLVGGSFELTYRESGMRVQTPGIKVMEPTSDSRLPA